MTNRTGTHPVSVSRVVWKTEMVVGAVVAALGLVGTSYVYLEARFGATQQAVQELRIQLAEDYATRVEVEQLSDTMEEVRRDLVRVWERVDGGHP